MVLELSKDYGDSTNYLTSDWKAIAKHPRLGWILSCLYNGTYKLEPALKTPLYENRRCFVRHLKLHNPQLRINRCNASTICTDVLREMITLKHYKFRRN